MSARLDLTGRVFGRLTVARAYDRVKWGGRWWATWLCRCECGVEVIVPQQRLPHYNSIHERQIVDACPACRAHPCAICETPILPPSTAATCSMACDTIYRRYVRHRNMTLQAERDPDFHKRKRRRLKQRAEIDPAVAARVAANEERRQEKNRLRRLDDPAYAERERERSRNAQARSRNRRALDQLTELRIELEKKL